MNNNKKSNKIWRTWPGVISLLAFVAVCSITAFARSAAQSPADATSDFTTSNGLKTVHRRIQANDVVAVQLYFRGGARNINDKNAGIETLMFEVAQQGTKNFSKGQINRELARMGTVIDSVSGYDFSAVAMRCVRGNFDRSWQLLTDIVLNPLFEEKEVALVKDQIINALRQQNDFPESQVAQISSNLLYAAHPYINSPDGTVESMSGLTAADLKSHHTKLVVSSRMLLVAVGNITQEEVKRKVEASFGKLPRGDYQNATPPRFAKATESEFKIVDKTVATNYIRGTFAAPPLDHPDYPAFYVAINILGQLLFQEVRVKRNLTYNVDATLLSNSANSGFLVVTTAKPNETITVMFNQIDFMKGNVLREEGLRALISGMLTTYYSKLETNYAQATRLAEYELLGSGWRRLGMWIEEVRKVSAEDIQRVSNTYLKNFHFAAVGNSREFDKGLFMSK